MSRPTASEAPALPVVAWRTRHPSEPGMIGHYPWSYSERATRRAMGYEEEPLVHLSDAQAALDKLTAERDALQASIEALVDLTSDSADQLRQERDEARAHFAQVCEQYDAMAGEFSALKASPAVNVDEAMRLADEWVVEAIHAALSANTGHTTLAEPDAAREALRAYLGGDRACR